MEYSDILLNILRTMSVTQLKALMSLSGDIASLNYTRYQNFHDSNSVQRLLGNGIEGVSDGSLKPAALVFDGPAYRGLRADCFNLEESQRAQGCLRILSGLYGVLRPFDLIQEYRLEMGTKLPVDSAKNLVEFWGSVVTRCLDDELAELSQRLHMPKIIVNVASAEYFKVIDKTLLSKDVHVIECVFKDKGRIVSVSELVTNNVVSCQYFVHVCVFYNR
jgi:cytoplasmic iron level regulating protein YaaA (DUF328/UPF0246 family)